LIGWSLSQACLASSIAFEDIVGRKKSVRSRELKYNG